VCGRMSGRLQGRAQEDRVAGPGHGGGWQHLVQPWHVHSAALRLSPTDPALRDNYYLKVTVPKKVLT
jgi:hypothetical protein